MELHEQKWISRLSLNKVRTLTIRWEIFGAMFINSVKSNNGLTVYEPLIFRKEEFKKFLLNEGLKGDYSLTKFDWIKKIEEKSIIYSRKIEKYNRLDEIIIDKTMITLRSYNTRDYSPQPIFLRIEELEAILQYL